MSENIAPDIRNQHGSISWGELTTSEPRAAAEFYQKTLGWTFKEENIGAGPYICFYNSQGKAVGGSLLRPDSLPSEIPNHWAMYVTVDDVDAALTAAEANGGSITCPATDIPGVGRLAHFKDPQGAAIAIITYENPIE